jgi:tRNA(Leu) C34 or U34 (ribose-2'-O)-methylase TrmL
MPNSKKVGDFVRGYCGVGLYSPKNPINIGGASRAAACYGASFVAIQSPRVSMKSIQDTTKYWRHSPVLRVDNLKDILPYGCIPIAVDIIEGARNLVDFTHPERALYIFGPEDGTLGEDITSWCDHVIKIPTQFCMNLAATVNVVLYDRLAKHFS